MTAEEKLRILRLALPVLALLFATVYWAGVKWMPARGARPWSLCGVGFAIGLVGAAVAFYLMEIRVGSIVAGLGWLLTVVGIIWLFAKRRSD